MKKIVISIILVLLFNAIVLGSCIKSGADKGDLMYRFHEKEAVTFLSALMLGLTSLISLILYLLMKRIPDFVKGAKFWGFTALGFFYLCMGAFIGTQIFVLISLIINFV